MSNLHYNDIFSNIVNNIPTIYIHIYDNLKKVWERSEYNSIVAGRLEPGHPAHSGNVQFLLD